MKLDRFISFGVTPLFLIACGENSTAVTNIEENPIAVTDTLLSSPSEALPSESLLPGEAVNLGETETQQAYSSEQELFSLSSSSAGFPTTSSTDNGAGNVTSSTDTEGDDNVNLTGGETTLNFSGTDVTIENDNGCLEKATGSITVKCSGNYYLKGSASDYQVIVNTASSDTGKVDLFLNGVSLKSSDAPIYVQNADKTELHLVEGTSNTIEDGATRTKSYNVNNKVDTTKAAIYAKDDLSIKGSGSLVVKGNFNNGIHTSNDLKIKNSTGTLNVTAQNNGLKGKGSVTVNGGNITINATQGDGIKSDEDDVAELAEGKGSVIIAGGNINITSAYDGITASNLLQVTTGESGEPTIKIKTGGGQNCLGTNNGGNQGGWGGFGGMGGGMSSGNSCAPDSSMKGLKADSNIVIEAGKIEIDSRDDGLHSDGSITINGGFTTVKTDDDGVHAEKALTIKNGTVEVTMAYEGMEAPEMNFEGGVTSVFTTDDGWNAAGGTSSTGGNTGWGGMGGGSNTNCKLKVTGGIHYVYVGTGDTDGIDSNGSIEISGGIVIVECRMNGGMGGAVDSDGSTSITGGKLLGFATNNSEEGTQYNVNFTTSNYYGTSEVAFKPSFSGSKMISNMGQPGVVNSVDGMNKQCFGNSTTNCVYYK